MSRGLAMQQVVPTCCGFWLPTKTNPGSGMKLQLSLGPGAPQMMHDATWELNIQYPSPMSNHQVETPVFGHWTFRAVPCRLVLRSSQSEVGSLWRRMVGY